MVTYPTGVLQNMTAPGGIPNLQPVPETSWHNFGPSVEADLGLKQIRTVAPNAFMEAATSGEYSQYVYLLPDPDIIVRLAAGEVILEDGTKCLILEYPTAIYDASITPRPFIDSYTPGERITLKCQRITEVWGQLFWTER